MSFPVLPNPSNFLGVALVINRSRDGPRFVFHYPPQVISAKDRQDNEDGGVGGDDDVDDDADDMLLERGRSSRYGENGLSSLSPEEILQRDPDAHHETDSGTQVVPWEHVAGFPTKDLESILTPARAYHKKLFQLSLDPLYFVSYPVCVPENGVWRKKKKKAQQRAKSATAKEKTRDDEENASMDTDGANGDFKASDLDHSEGRDTVRAASSAAAMKNGDETEDKDKDKDKDKRSSMTMFNLVFILDPKKHEVKDLVDLMYTHIIKKVNKAYKYCQQRTDYVWKESKKILALKDKGREDKRRMSSLWQEILAASSLAASMQDIYDAVSQNKIAALQLDTPEGMVTPSVQIPRPFHIPDLPQEGEWENSRGLWLTTANSFVLEDTMDDPAYLDKNFALLLLDDEKKIIAELQADPDETTLAMIEFVRHCKPTLSFHQVGQQPSNILTPLQVRKFAQHFIFWRRAMAIPPLHARDMYMVSPNSDMATLPHAAAQWARQFPLAPALPNFLAELSVAPRPYKTHCPSKAHRPAYMAMLAWLMRGGWVTQLCTFAYVVVWPEIVYEVEYALEAEELARAREAQDRGGAPGSVESSSTHGDGDGGRGESAAASNLGDAALAGFGFLPLMDSSASLSSRGVDLGASTTTARDLSLSSLSLAHSHAQNSSSSADEPSSENSSPSSSFRPETLSPTSTRLSQTSYRSPISTTTTHPHHQPQSPPPPPHSPRAAEPTPAEKAAETARLARLADKAARALADRATAHARKAAPQQTAHPSANMAAHLTGLAPHVILDAKKATGKESLYLSAIEKRLRGKATAAEAGPRNGSLHAHHGSDGKGKGKERERERDRLSGGSGTGGGLGITNPPLTPSPSPVTRGGGRTAGSILGPGPKKDGGVGLGVGGSNSGVGRHGKDREREEREWNERVARAWPLFWKYFNGRSALERIALQEEMKRKDVWNLLTSMSEYLLCVRTW